MFSAHAHGALRAAAYSQEMVLRSPFEGLKSTSLGSRYHFPDFFFFFFFLRSQDGKLQGCLRGVFQQFFLVILHYWSQDLPKGLCVDFLSGKQCSHWKFPFRSDKRVRGEKLSLFPLTHYWHHPSLLICICKYKCLSRGQAFSLGTTGRVWKTWEFMNFLDIDPEIRFF